MREITIRQFNSLNKFKSLLKINSFSLEMFEALKEMAFSHVKLIA